MTTNVHWFTASESQTKERSKFGKKDLNDKQLHGMAKINEAAQYFIDAIILWSPPSADQSAAIRSARLAAMQTNAAICWDWPEGVE